MIHFGEDIWVCMIVVSIINAILSLVGLFVSAFGAFKASRDVSHISETTSLGYNSQLTKSPKKQFDNMALYFQCRINKNALLQTVFLAILPLGYFVKKK